MNKNIPSSLNKIVKVLEDKKGIDIRILDIRDLVSYTDFLVLCSGTSSPHVNALVESVRESFSQSEGPVYLNSSKDDSWWILDFVDVVVHVFKENERRFYDLEQLWGDAKKMSVFGPS